MVPKVPKVLNRRLSMLVGVACVRGLSDEGLRRERLVVRTDGAILIQRHRGKRSVVAWEETRHAKCWYR